LLEGGFPLVARGFHALVAPTSLHHPDFCYFIICYFFMLFGFLFLFIGI
jgi:hypothetical protein